MALKRAVWDKILLHCSSDSSEPIRLWSSWAKARHGCLEERRLERWSLRREVGSALRRSEQPTANGEDLCASSCCLELHCRPTRAPKFAFLFVWIREKKSEIKAYFCSEVLQHGSEIDRGSGAYTLSIVAWNSSLLNINHLSLRALSYLPTFLFVIGNKFLPGVGRKKTNQNHLNLNH